LLSLIFVPEDRSSKLFRNTVDISVKATVTQLLVNVFVLTLVFVGMTLHREHARMRKHLCAPEHLPLNKQAMESNGRQISLVTLHFVSVYRHRQVFTNNEI
jgi:hypothetical protein